YHGRMEGGMRGGFQFEQAAWGDGHQRVAGVDEVGRGALFGPVVAASVKHNANDRIRGLNDSKQLDAATRERLSAAIQARAICWAVAAEDAGVIDAINILQASRRAMRRALEMLAPQPDFALVDAVALDWPGPQLALIKGDARSDSIAAASIVAKVHRDALL